jgi:CheY-like chemotaxis protein
VAVRRKILCVDDDGDDRYLLASVLRDLAPQLEIVEAENGQQALAWLKQAKKESGLPCLVVLDINMPLLDGRQTLERIREDNDLLKVPVVIFTSSERPADKLFFNSKGIELVVKPFNYRHFGAAIGHFVRGCCS